MHLVTKAVILILILMICLIAFAPTFSDTIESYTDQSDNYITYFIVLTSYPERLKNIKSIINNHKITNPYIFDAINGKYLDRNTLYQNGDITKRTRYKMKAGALGCALSHIQIWKNLIKSDKQFALVCEDDIKLTSKFSQQIKNYIHQLPKDFDISILTDNPIIDYKSNFNRTDNVNTLVKRGYPEYGTISYLISRRGARKLLNTVIPIYEPIDNMILSEIKKKNIVSYKPITSFVFLRGEIQSSIGYVAGNGGWNR